VATKRAGALQGQAAERHQKLTVETPAAPLQVGIEPSLAEVLVRNLVDNALRYSPAGGQVRVVVGTDPAGRALLVVEDSGPGMAPEEMARLGERFYRVLGTDATGSGLGWSIVQRIARLYGLQLEVGRSNDLGGLRVRVAWPGTPIRA
jgi:two-component system, OmpR family, sensor histidine kinase QseC